MSSWKNIDLSTYGPISRIVEIFQIGPPLKGIPIPAFKIKILERQDGTYFGVPNVAIKDSEQNLDWIGGFGNTIDEALLDTLKCFYVQIEEIKEVSKNDFVYADASDFL